MKGLPYFALTFIIDILHQLKHDTPLYAGMLFQWLPFLRCFLIELWKFISLISA